MERFFWNTDFLNLRNRSIKHATRNPQLITFSPDSSRKPFAGLLPFFLVIKSDQRKLFFLPYKNATRQKRLERIAGLASKKNTIL